MSVQVDINQSAGTATMTRLFRLFNDTARELVGSGREWVPISAEELVANAERATGLSDWGDYHFMDALKVLAYSLDHEAMLSMAARIVVTHDNIGQYLKNRLELERDWKAHPEILDVPINRPIFIVGLPRTGSTLLHRMLARDPNARAPYVWEQYAPMLPKNMFDRFVKPSRVKTRLRIEMLEYLAPNFATAHEIVNGEPEECVGMLQHTMVSDSMELFANLPSYRKYVGTADYREPYAYYKKQLQTLTWKNSGAHWVLKSPFHQRGLEALMETFPDALIIQTHRDPIKVAPSWCSLYHAAYEASTASPDPLMQGGPRLDWLSEVSDITLGVRKKLGDDRFIDVGFSEMMSDPIAVIRRIYDRAGMVFSPTVESAMRSWHATNPQHKRGVHKYSPEDFGLTDQLIKTRLKTYYEAFDDYLY